MVLVASLVFVLVARGQAYDFCQAIAPTDTLYYKITSSVLREVKVVNPTGNMGNRTWEGHLQPHNTVNIPATVTHGGQTYSVTAIGSYAFGYCYGFYGINIPQGVTSIGRGAFYNCTSLMSVSLPNSVTVVDTQAFSNCSGLVTLTLPTALRRVAYSAFSSCSGLRGTLTIPDQVTTIEAFAFGNCNAVTTLVVGRAVRTIGPRAFAMCFRLNYIDMLPTVPPRIDSTTFSYHTLGVNAVSPSTRVHVPCGSLPAYLTAPNWNYFSNIFQDPTCPRITRYDTSVCANKFPVTWRGHSYSTYGSAIDTLRAANGTDSLVIYTVMVKDTSVYRMRATACISYTWHGQVYRQTGTYTHRMANSNQFRCDSVDVLELEIRHSSSGDTVVTACDSFVWNGRTYTSSTALSEGSSAGKFSVSSTLQVAFATGNLQYRASDNQWRIAPEQYGVRGTANRNIGPQSADWIDLFGWGTSGWNNGNVYYYPHNYQSNANGATGYGYGPVDGSSYQADLRGRFANADWCVYNAIAGAGNEAGLWRTLTNDEWRYVISGRPNANVLKGAVTISDQGRELGSGLLLLPDDWQLPSGLSFTSTGQNRYTLAQWRTMEAAGAVMLPTTGNRQSQLYLPTTNGNYWSSTHDGNDKAYYLYFGANGSSVYTNVAERNRGHAVRPARDLPTRTFIGGNAAGCDSTVTLRLTIYHPTSGDTNVTVCDSMVWHGNRLSSSGSYSSDSLPHPFTLTNSHGCDSTARLHLTVNRSSHSRVDDTIVLAQLPWRYYSYRLATVVFAPGSRQWDTVVNVSTLNHSGCDSLIEYHLAVRRDVTDTVDSTLCENMLPLTWNGMRFDLSMCSQQGQRCVIMRSKRFAGGGSHGEDSLLVMRLTVHRNSYSTYYDTVVENSLPHRYGPIVVRRLQGIDTTVLLTNSHGCDSIVSYHLYVHRNVRDTIDSVVCQEQLPLRWNGHLFDTTGIGSQTGSVWTVQHSVTLRLHTGADSILLMRLHVHRNSHTVLYDTIVQNQLPYTIMGCRFNGFGADTVITLRDRAGCDSLVHYHLYVSLNSISSADSVVCEGDLPLRWNSKLFDTTGIYRITGIWNVQQTDTLRASTGADSVVLMRLHVLRNSRRDYYDTVVQNALPRMFRGRSFYHGVADTLFVLANAVGCDSLLHYHLYVCRNVSDTLDSVVCYSSLPLLWGHSLFLPPPGGSGVLVQSDTLLTRGGADSVVVRRVWVRAVYNRHIFDTICSDSSRLFGDSVYRQQGVYPHTFHTIAGCDSTVTLHLTVHAVTYGNYYDTTTENNLPHTFLGTRFTAFSADTTLHSVNRHGCDSVIHYRLFVHRNVYHTADSTVCEGMLPLRWNSRLFDTTGISTHQAVLHIVQTDTLRAHSGADSVLTMRLHVLRNSHSDYFDTAIENALPITFMGARIGARNSDTTLHTRNAAGCDSAVHLRLHIYYNIVDTAYIAACPSALPVVWNGIRFTADSTARYYMAGAGCHGEDSTVVMRFVVLANTRSQVADTIVENQLPWRYRDSLFSTAATNRHFVAVNAVGCDSLIDYSLYVYWNQYTSLDSTVCEGVLPLSWGRWQWTVGGGNWTVGYGFELGTAQHTDTLATVGGADSVVNYTLHVLRNSTAWRADSVVERQMPYSTMGCRFGRAVADTTVVLVNAVGCDSIVHYSLYVWPDRRRLVDSALCEGLLPLRWHRYSLRADSCVHDTVRRIGRHGEDSITTLCLHVLHNSSSQVVEHVLQNDLPHLYHGRSFADTVSHVPFVIANAAGCDSMIDYSLAICRNNAAEADSDVCAARLPLRWNGATLTGDTTLNVLLTNSCGADSLLRMTVMVRDSSSSRVADTIVENQLPWTFNGRRFTGGMPSTYIVINNRYGCDSVIHYSLYVHGNINIRLDTAVCEETLPLLWEGHRFDTAGTQSYTYPAVSGADSTRHYTLTVWPRYELHDTVAACDTFVWCGSPFTRSGHYLSSSLHTLATIHGCDSLRHLHLTIGHANGGTATVRACGSYEWLGNTLTHSGTYMSPDFAQLLNRDGCDSVATLQLTLFSLDTTQRYDTFCMSSPYLYYDTLLTQGGTYYRHFADRHGCDSLDVLHLNMLTPPTLRIDVERLCNKRSYLLRCDTLLRYILWGSSPVDTLLDGTAGSNEVTVSPAAPTLYTLYADYYDYPRCPGSVTITLAPLEPVKAKMDYNPTYLMPDRLTLTAIDRSLHTQGRKWYVDGQYQDDKVNFSYTAGVLDSSVTLWLEVYNDVCHDTAIAIVPVLLGTIYVPNSFTPDEPTNNRFRVFGSDIKDYHIAIYSRNGLVIYESYNPEAEWDGTYKGKPCPQGSYVYVISYRDKLSLDALLHKTGTILLLR